MKVGDTIYLKITPEIKDFCINYDLECYDHIAAKVDSISKLDNKEVIYSLDLGHCNPHGSLYTLPVKDIETSVNYLYPKEGKVYSQNLIDTGDSITLSSSIDNTIYIPKKIAEIKLCGVITYSIPEVDNFIKPTPEQIKNLHDMLCIDVELFD